MFRVRIEIFLEINVEFKMLNCYFMLLIIIFYLFFFVLQTKDVSNYKKEHKQFNMDVVSALQNQGQEYRENKNATTTQQPTQSSVAALAMLLPLEQRQLQQTLKKVNRLKFDWKNPAEILSIICCFAEDIEHT